MSPRGVACGPNMLDRHPVWKSYPLNESSAIFRGDGNPTHQGTLRNSKTTRQTQISAVQSSISHWNPFAPAQSVTRNEMPGFMETHATDVSDVTSCFFSTEFNFRTHANGIGGWCRRQPCQLRTRWPRNLQLQVIQGMSALHISKFQTFSCLRLGFRCFISPCVGQYSDYATVCTTE